MATPKINISKISDFPKVTPIESDRILIDREGKGGSITLSQIPVSDPVGKRISDEVEDLSNRIDNIASVIPEGGTTGDAELREIRVGADGTVYPTAAKAVQTQVSNLQDGIDELKGDLTNSKKAIAELDDKKITKFYASNNGNTNLPDSDSGKPTDMKIFGKSVQDGTPSPSNPIEIQSVVNPKVKMIGKNLAKNIAQSKTVSGVTFTVNDDKSITVVGTANKPIEFKLNDWIDNQHNDLDNGTYYISDGGVNAILILNIFENGKYNGGKMRTSFTITDSIKGGSLYIYINKGITVNETLYPQIEVGSVATEYVPYQEQSASLPYTLNAIPVTSGGNVTIDGQQYIADYVDIEKKQLIRNVGEVDLGTLEFIQDGITYRNQLSNFKITDNTKPVLALCERYYPVSYNSTWNKTGMMAQDSSNRIIFVNSELSSVSEFKQSVSGTKLLYALKTPTITDLTDEEVQAFKELATHYPITNVSTTSDQLDGYTTFNYPLNMANGWNYVMQQIGETRPIIYVTQVKTIENIIDTAILTAMMEA